MRLKIVVACSALLVFIIAMAVALFWSPKVTIRCSRDQEGRLIVDLKPNWRVNAILKVFFWQEGDDEYLWVLRKGQVPMRTVQVPIRRIVYGELPHGATQKYPAHNVPPKQVPSGGILYVGVKYQWDSNIPPAAVTDTSAVKLQLTEDGGVKPLGDAELGEGLIWPKTPKAPENPSSP